MRLIDADVLKTRVPNTSADIFENCRNCKLLDDWQVKELIDNAPTVEPASPWHRVDEPPKENGKYVAINAKANWWYEASYENGNWKAVDLFGQRWVVIHPTHWMPIEPPKEDE